MKIFIVYGSMDYEGSDNIKAFIDDDMASKFRKECEDYDASRPWRYGDEDIDSDEFDKIIKKWEDEHPAQGCYFDSYGVEEMDVE